MRKRAGGAPEVKKMSPRGDSGRVGSHVAQRSRWKGWRVILWTLQVTPDEGESCGNSRGRNIGPVGEDHRMKTLCKITVVCNSVAYKHLVLVVCTF